MKKKVEKEVCRKLNYFIEMAEKNIEENVEQESAEVENIHSAAVDEGYKELTELLKICKLEHLLSTFVKEEVDDDFLFKLDVESSIEWNPVASLLPTIGSRGRFRSAVKKYQVSVCYVFSCLP